MTSPRTPDSSGEGEAAMPHTTRVLGDVLAERMRQDEQWGEQNHEPEVWLAILGEEFGELAQAVLAARFGKADHSSHNTGMRAEAVQIAAVAVAIVECIDRHDVERAAP